MLGLRALRPRACQQYLLARNAAFPVPSLPLTLAQGRALSHRTVKDKSTTARKPISIPNVEDTAIQHDSEYPRIQPTERALSCIQFVKSYAAVQTGQDPEELVIIRGK
jgi:hypothetical protein